MKHGSVSFIRANYEYPGLWDGEITALDEYWGDDGTAPEWRLEMKIGRPIYEAAEEKNT